MISLRRPLGLVLAGGGALGAWQAGALAALEEAGVAFDGVLGFSAGAINGAAYTLGLVEEARRRWTNVRWPLRPAPRLWPLSLCSTKPLLKEIDYALDEKQARARARCRFVVASAHVDRCRAVYAEFDPRGRWDERLDRHLLATCAIPTIFPPVDVDFRGMRVRLIDGGVPTRTPFSFAPLGPCADVLVLEMVRPEEVEGPLPWNPWRRGDKAGRRSVRRLIDEGAASLASASPAPRVLRLHPSVPLGRMLDFSREKAGLALALGAADARAFLRA